MKILFLVKSDKTPSSRIRVRSLAPFLRNYGIDTDIEAIPQSFFAKRKLFKKAEGYSVVVLQKRMLSFLDFRKLRRNSRKLVFDFDDAVYCRNASCSPDPGDYESPTRMRKFARTISSCDLVIASNRVLAEKTARTAPDVPVRVVPSSIPLDSVVVKADYSLHSPPVLGWVGTKSTLRYVGMVAPALRELRGKTDFTLKIISDGKFADDGFKVECIPWSIEAQNREIPLFDVGIMPLSKDPFSEGKSAYKLLQYMAAGVPSVCSPVGMNADVAGSDEFCLTASSNSEFTLKIMRLLGNFELRRTLGEKGRRLVSEKYSSEAAAELLAETLRPLL